MKALMPYVKMMFVEKKDIFLSIFAGFMAGITAVGLFSASGYLISQAALTPPIATLMVIVAIVKLLGITSAISRYGERYFSHRATFTLLSNIRLRVYEKLEPVSSKILHHYRSGDLLSRIVGDVDSLQNLLLRVVYPPVVMVSVFLVTIAFTSIFSVGTAVLLFIGLFATLLIIPTAFYVGHRAMNHHIRETRGNLSSTFAEYVYGFRELTIHQATDERQEQVLTDIRTYEKQKQQSQAIHMWSDATVHFFSLFVSVAVLAYAGLQVVDGNLAGILLAMLLMISLTVFEQVTPMALLPYHLQESAHSAKRLEAITAEPMEQREHVDYNGQTAPDLSLQHVTFTFDGEQRPALQDVSFHVKPGSKTAIIGASGSGKSTIAHLILKSFPYSKGSITVNGTELKHIDEKKWWKTINMSLQSNHFFVGTLEENLRTANENASVEEMARALQQAELSHLQLGDRVDEKGANLSGGEKQRLAIARLLLRRHATLWILDEPTSSLDALTEERMLQLLFNQAKDATVLFISHRLTGLEDMDQILVVDQGKIIETGTYEQLMEQNGYFRRMKELERELFAIEKST
ncbi:thiol reductant ABC exporter subunit CydC [Halalkalibacterium halodurans]|uniref:thiol reductant ABC exporter subunit CydC n=1 Tax=Halalkalibacterium halodurans TaxID=86665 RepID=UPI002E1A8FB0|nr:thiol reductant ABC exporter subunit CydC [Halalkalibacterium halodurans]MED4174528.1 thiol reductant ABC exporter subunit CydC [Halalkalibacterium halodurans]